MSYRNKGSMPVTVTVSRLPDGSGNFVCDGMADDVEIQAAIDYVTTLGGGRVHLSIGTYDLTATILLDSDLIFEGEGETTFLVRNHATADFAIKNRNIGAAGYAGNSNITMRKFKIDGVKTTYSEAVQGMNGILGFAHCQDILVEEVHFVNSHWHSIEINSTQGATIRKNISEDAVSAVYQVDRGCPGCFASPGFNGDGTVCYNINLSENYSYRELKSFNIHDTGQHQIRIHGNHIIDSIGAGVHGDEDTVHYDISVTNNHFENVSAGVLCDAIYFGPVQGLVISDNVINMGAGSNSGIQLYSTVGTTVNGAVIDSNIIKGEGNDRIRLRNAESCVISNNQVFETDANMSAVMFYGVKNSIIIGNHFEGSGTGNQAIDLFPGTFECDDNSIIANQLYNWTVGINIQASGANNRVFLNQFSGCTTNIVDAGTDTKLATKSFQFQHGGTVEGTVAATEFVSATASAKGWQVDAGVDWAVALGHLPSELQQVVRIKIWAVALGAPVNSPGQMHLEIVINAGADDLAFNTEPVALANFDSVTTDYVANDVVHWSCDSGDDADIGHMTGGMSIEFKVIYEAAADPDGATNAVFRTVEVEYV